MMIFFGNFNQTVNRTVFDIFLIEQLIGQLLTYFFDKYVRTVNRTVIDIFFDKYEC